MKTKIAIIRPGIHTLDEQFCISLAKEGFEVTLLAPKNSFATPNQLHNPNYNIKLFHCFKFFGFVDLPVFFGLFFYLVTNKFAVVQSNEDFQYATWIAALYAKIFKKKFVLIEERYFMPRRLMHRIIFTYIQHYISPFVWRNASSIICHSTASLQFMRQYVPSSLQNKLLYLPIGVNTSVFYPPTKKLKKSVLRIVTVGRLIDHKDYFTLLQALHLLNTKQVRFSLTIIGKGYLKDRILKKIKDYNLQKQVKLYESIPFANLRKMYALHDVFILSSKVEPIGAAITEAMACGLPIIVSDSGGMKDYVTEGKNGYVFPTGDYRNLADKIIKLHTRNKQNSFGNKSIILVKKHFDWNVLIKKYIPLLLA